MVHTTPAQPSGAHNGQHTDKHWPLVGTSVAWDDFGYSGKPPPGFQVVNTNFIYPYDINRQPPAAGNMSKFGYEVTTILPKQILISKM